MWLISGTKWQHVNLICTNMNAINFSHPLAKKHIEAVDRALSELDVSAIPRFMMWNKFDKISNPDSLRLKAEKRGDVVCISSLSGEDLNDFCSAIQDKLKVLLIKEKVKLLWRTLAEVLGE